MTSHPAPDHGPDRLGPTRRRVLAYLQETADPTSTDILAERLDLHPNTVRFHLDALLAAGLVRRIVEHRAVQGRPRVLFSAAPTVPPVTDLPYRSLVQAVLGHLRTDPDTEQPAAVQIGEAWGRSLAEADAGLVAGTEALVDVVNALGLSSRIAETDGVRHLEIVRCPFRDLTIGGDATACRIHLGMMRGYLAARGADETVAELRPWVGPELCLARLDPSVELMDAQEA
ncbi:MAG: helix-turn-helix domain-containing protein [Micropruina sp.]|uniref:helix-turn-helix transcriptional regulator n=1 Tax=Micropruina sp. TaxID=2737536 RepID=UPI0039E59DD4